MSRTSKTLGNYENNKTLITNEIRLYFYLQVTVSTSVCVHLLGYLNFSIIRKIPEGITLNHPLIRHLNG